MWSSKSFVLFLLGQIFQLTCGEEKNKGKPNIIIILADDVGYNDFSFHGSNEIPTPNIDALGYNGVILDKFYTQQTCTPSRAALLTGKYPFRLGLQGIPLDPGENKSLPFDTLTMPEHLKKLGYSNHLVGKWHLGAACKEHTPTRRGFDTHFGYWSGFVGYYSYEINVTDPSSNGTKNFSGFDLHDGFKPQWALQGQYATELFTKKSLEIIENHNPSVPLFLMLSHLAGHTGQDGIELEVPNKTRTDEVFHYIEDGGRRMYADVVSIMDDSVGKIVQKLSDKGMLQNSIILFFSDNGAQTQGLFQNFGSNWPHRGLKFTLLEGGVRGSGVIYSPLLKKKGYVNRELIHITDFLPTFYKAAGGNIKDLGTIDGVNQWDTISKNTTTKRSSIVLNIDEAGGYWGLLDYDGQYKLLNGSFAEGIYTNFYGSSGRGSGIPEYNLTSILQSPTNIAIEKLKVAKPLDEKIIKTLREEVTVDNCRPENISELSLCNDLCLYDIYADPCETKNLAEDKSMEEILDKMLYKYKKILPTVVPAKPKEIDVNSDPKRFNNTWTPWLKCNKPDSFLDILKKLYLNAVKDFNVFIFE